MAASVQLEAMVGTDKAGYAGLADQVDSSSWSARSAPSSSHRSSLLARISRRIPAITSLDALGDTAAQQAAAESADEIIDRQLNIQPTITVRPGFKLNILVNKDMILEPYPAG